MHNGGMFLRSTRRLKDGKEHRYWSIVESRRRASRRVLHKNQRPVVNFGLALLAGTVGAVWGPNLILEKVTISLRLAATRNVWDFQVDVVIERRNRFAGHGFDIVGAHNGVIKAIF